MLQSTCAGRANQKQTSYNIGKAFSNMPGTTEAYESISRASSVYSNE